MVSPVRRQPLLEGEFVTVRDNLCRRHGRELSPTTEPLEFDELVLPRQGAWVRHLPRKQVLIDTTRFHWFARGSRYRASHPGRCGDRNTGIELTPAAMESLRADGSNALWRDVLQRATDSPLPVGVWVEHLSLTRGMSRGDVPSGELEERILLLVSDLLHSLSGDLRGVRVESATHIELALEARSFLACKLEEAPSVGETARTLGVSPFHLCRVFKAVTGRTMHQYLQDLRVRAAILKILEGDEDIVEVAAATGFGGRSQLSRAVRAATGISPRGLRRQNRWNLGRS